MKRKVAVVACIALVALLAGTMFNSVAFGGSNPILDAILKAIKGIESRIDDLNATVTEQQQQISELQSQLDSLNNTLTSRIEALELNQSALEERIAALEDLLRPPEEVTFLDDRFDTGLDNWSYWEEPWPYPPSYPPFSNYELQWASNAARISGDGYPFECGMQKVVDLSGWNESGALLLSFDWRATSGFPTEWVTNAHLLIQDADSDADLDADSDASLYLEDLLLGGTLDTGWRNYANDISSYVQGHARIRIVLYLFDIWIADWGQTNIYDNIKLISTTSP